ncbi:MAG: heme biosynthesis protein HemY, partial [Xanthobacteraceae bacterium]
RDRLKRIEALAKQTPDNIDGALALARAALDARDFAKARDALKPYLEAPTKRVCLLMAALERAERSDEGRAREWTARAVNAAPDPTWTADGYVSNRWLPASPVTGRIDAFEWRVPLTGTLSAQLVEPIAEPEPSAVKSVTAPPELEKIEVLPAIATSVSPGTVKSPAKAESKPIEIKPEPVIPLVHAPDDPGPDVVDEIEPDSEQSDGGWRKILG